MNWDRIEGNWKQLRGKVQQQWGKLTDDDLTTIEGRRVELVGPCGSPRVSGQARSPPAHHRSNIGWTTVETSSRM